MLVTWYDDDCIPNLHGIWRQWSWKLFQHILAESMKHTLAKRRGVLIARCTHRVKVIVNHAIKLFTATTAWHFLNKMEFIGIVLSHGKY